PSLGTQDGSRWRRELQRAYVARPADLVANPGPTVPPDAVSLSRLYLTRVADACQKDLVLPLPKSDTVRAHLMELRARARRALEAQRDATPARAGAAGNAAPVAGGNN